MYFSLTSILKLIEENSVCQSLKFNSQIKFYPALEPLDWNFKFGLVGRGKNTQLQLSTPQKFVLLIWYGTVVKSESSFQHIWQDYMMHTFLKEVQGI